MSRTTIDVSRIVRIVSVGLAILAGASVYVSYEPQVESLRTRVDEARADVRSGDIVLADRERLRTERAAFERRYARLFAQNPQAVFLRELSATAGRHGIDVVGSASGHARLDSRDETVGTFKRVALTLQLRGSYRNLLAAIAEISQGNEIVAVEVPSLQRDGDSIVASVPVAIFEPGSNVR
jgi:Tfp pilus assembly protein PilO